MADETGQFKRTPNTLIRESLAVLDVRMGMVISDIKELKEENLEKFEDQGKRLASLERKQLWVQAWSAGAAAILGILVYLMGKIPNEAWIALAKVLVQ